VIDIREGEKPPWGPFNEFPQKELEVLRDWIKEMLGTGNILRSKSPLAAPVLFVRKHMAEELLFIYLIS
jgi:hypothetical protein